MTQGPFPLVLSLTTTSRNPYIPRNACTGLGDILHMATAYPLQPPTKQVLLTLRADHVRALDGLVGVGAARDRSELVDKVIGGFLADIRPRPNPQEQPNQGALGAFIAFILVIIGAATVLKALGGED